MIHNFYNIIGGASSATFDPPIKTDQVIKFINNPAHNVDMIQEYILNCKFNGSHFHNQIKWHTLLLNSSRDIDLKLQILNFLRINIIDSLFSLEDTNIFNPISKIKIEINQYVHYCINLESRIDSEDLNIDETIAIMTELIKSDSFDDITLQNAHNFILTLYFSNKIFNTSKFIDIDTKPILTNVMRDWKNKLLNSIYLSNNGIFNQTLINYKSITYMLQFLNNIDLTSYRDKDNNTFYNNLVSTRFINLCFKLYLHNNAYNIFKFLEEVCKTVNLSIVNMPNKFGSTLLHTFINTLKPKYITEATDPIIQSFISIIMKASNPKYLTSVNQKKKHTTILHNAIFQKLPLKYLQLIYENNNDLLITPDINNKYPSFYTIEHWYSNEVIIDITNKTPQKFYKLIPSTRVSPVEKILARIKHVPVEELIVYKEILQKYINDNNHLLYIDNLDQINKLSIMGEDIFSPTLEHSGKTLGNIISYRIAKIRNLERRQTLQEFDTYPDERVHSRYDITKYWNLIQTRIPELEEMLHNIGYSGNNYILIDGGAFKINKTNNDPKYEILDASGKVMEEKNITKEDIILTSYLENIKGPNGKFNLFSTFYKYENDGWDGMDEITRYPGIDAGGVRNSVLEEISEIFSKKFIKYRENSYTTFSMLTEKTALIVGILIGRMYRFGILADDKASPILPFSLLPLYMQNLFFGVSEEFERRHIKKIIEPTIFDIVRNLNESINYIKKYFHENGIEITHETKEAEIKKKLEDYTVKIMFLPLDRTTIDKILLPFFCLNGYCDENAIYIYNNYGLITDVDEETAEEYYNILKRYPAILRRLRENSFDLIKEYLIEENGLNFNMYYKNFKRHKNTIIKGINLPLEGFFEIEKKRIHDVNIDPIEVTFDFLSQHTTYRYNSYYGDSGAIINICKKLIDCSLKKLEKEKQLGYYLKALKGYQRISDPHERYDIYINDPNQMQNPNLQYFIHTCSSNIEINKLFLQKLINEPGNWEKQCSDFTLGIIEDATNNNLNSG